MDLVTFFIAQACGWPDDPQCSWQEVEQAVADYYRKVCTE